MESSAERLQQYINHKGLSNREFEKSLSMANGLVAKNAKNKGTINIKLLKKILHQYPDLNQDWLMTGSGEMLKREKNTSNDAETRNIAGDKLTPTPSMETMVQNLQNENSKLKEEIALLKHEVAHQQKIIEKLEKLNEALEANLEDLRISRDTPRKQKEG